MDKTEVICNAKSEMIESVNALMEVIENDDTIDCAKALRETELKIVAATDKMAGKLIEAVVDIALNDEQIIAEGKKLAKSSSVRMKNYGKRSVAIHPYRGDPFTAKTTYYCRAGVLPKKGLKKKGSILN